MNQIKKLKRMQVESEKVGNNVKYDNMKFYEIIKISQMQIVNY